MPKLFLVYSGEYFCMDVRTKQLEGLLPALRIEGVFTSRKKCDEWIESYSAGKPLCFVSCIELDPNPVYGRKESELQQFRIRMNKELQILETTNVADITINSEELCSFEVKENGDIVGHFWARDLYDACKVAYINVQELTGN